MIKKALLVGINAYPGAPLEGCLNDVDQMYGLLTGTFGFEPKNIKTLKDAEATYEGMEKGLSWLAEAEPGTGPGDVRVFHYSGHGSYVADENKDEADGSDEALCPFDYATKGFLIDDRLAQLYNKVPKGSNLTLLMDCCHSGGIQRDVEKDIRYRFLPVSYETLNRIEAARETYAEERATFIKQEIRKLINLDEVDLDARIKKLTTTFNAARKRFGDVNNREGNILFAGCKNIQTSADAHIAGGYHGAFTYYFVDAIKHLGPGASMRQIMEMTGKSLWSHKYSQVPQLEGQKAHKELPLFSALPSK